MATKVFIFWIAKGWISKVFTNEKLARKHAKAYPHQMVTIATGDGTIVGGEISS